MILTTLDAVADIVNGGAWKQNEYTLSGVPVVRVTDVWQETVDLSECKFLSHHSAVRYSRHILLHRDVILCTVGSHPTQPSSVVGRVGIVPQSAAGALLNQNAVRLRALDGVDQAWLGYLCRSADFAAYVRACARGAANQVRMSIGLLRQLPVRLPPESVQRRIGSILSAYDDLIENCERRIRVLDEMARTLYREWFVLFRYPGHEKVPLVDSAVGLLPWGWAAECLRDGSGTVCDGDWVETKDQGGDEFRLVQISNVGVGEFIETGKQRFVTGATFDKLRCTEVVPGDLLVARMPTPTGRAWLVTKQPWRMITAVDVAIVRTNQDRLLAVYLVYAWNTAENLSRMSAQASGTTRPRVTRRELEALRFVIPPIGLQRRFQARVGALAGLANNLRLATNNLRQTRDLLLPRLLSGQIDLSDAP